MPFIRLFILEHRAFLTTSISLDGEIISSCSCYIKKGLVYVTIIDLFNRQPSSYTKCTKLNTYALYNMRLISFNKYTFLYYTHRCTY